MRSKHPDPALAGAAPGQEPVVVRIPALLHGYTGGATTATLAGLPAAAALDDALAELDRRFPGLRFRVVDEQGAIRRHIKIFVNGEPVGDLRAPLPQAADVMLVGALSGG